MKIKKMYQKRPIKSSWCFVVACNWNRFNWAFFFNWFLYVSLCFKKQTNKQTTHVSDRWVWKLTTRRSFVSHCCAGYGRAAWFPSAWIPVKTSSTGAPAAGTSCTFTDACEDSKNPTAPQNMKQRQPHCALNKTNQKNPIKNTVLCHYGKFCSPCSSRASLSPTWFILYIFGYGEGDFLREENNIYLKCILMQNLQCLLFLQH